MDYAAATPVDELVLKEMSPYWDKNFGNPGAIHEEGHEAKAIVEKSRSEIASVIGCRKEEIIFTSSGTESNNLAVFGFIQKKIMQQDLMYLISTQRR